MSNVLARIAEEMALRRTAEIYALGADRKDKTLWREVLADDCRIEGPGFAINGAEANLQSIDSLAKLFRGTLHKVHNQVVKIDGNKATGETYCTAEHLMKESDQVLRWSIRYLDEWRREEQTWRFTLRRLIVEWEELVQVKRK